MPTTAPSSAGVGGSSPAESELRLSWSVQGAPFGKGVALGGGYVLSLGSRRLQFHDAATGSLSAQREVCFTFSGALGLLDGATVAVVCENALSMYTLPGLEYRGNRALPRDARTAAFATKHLVVGFDRGPLLLLDKTDLAGATELPIPGTATSLAIADDGTWIAAGLDTGEVVLRTADNAEEKRITVKRGHRVTAVALSAGGRRVFAAAGPIVAVWRVADGQVERAFRSLRGANAARWWDGDELIVGGRDGLVRVRVSDGRVRSLPRFAANDAEMVALALTPGNERLCASEADGRVACMVRGGARGSPTPMLIPRGEEGVHMRGRVVFRRGRRLQIRARANASLPEAGDDAALVKYVETRVGPLLNAEWKRVARVAVTRVLDDVVHVRIVHEEVDLSVPRDPRRDPLVYDTAVKLVW